MKSRLIALIVLLAGFAALATASDADIAAVATRLGVVDPQ